MKNPSTEKIPQVPPKNPKSSQFKSKISTKKSPQAQILSQRFC